MSHWPEAHSVAFPLCILPIALHAAEVPLTIVQLWSVARDPCVRRPCMCALSPGKGTRTLLYMRRRSGAKRARQDCAADNVRKGIAMLMQGLYDFIEIRSQILNFDLSQCASVRG